MTPITATNGPLVLCYHAVSDRWPSELAISAERLEWQLRVLLARGYRAVTFSEAVAAPRAAKALVVTFDDGYHSVIDQGLPVLQRLGVPATLFMPSAFVGAQRLRWPGIDQWLDGPFADELAPVSWADLQSLVDAGWEIGSHTRTHPHLTELADDELNDELQDSRTALEDGLGRRCRSLAYPYGSVDRRVIAAAQRAGYEAAGALPIGFGQAEPLAWPRVGLYGTDGQWRFRLKVGRPVRALRATPAADAMLGLHRLALAVSGTGADNGKTATDTAPPATDTVKPAVLVTNAEERSVVAVTRGLGQGGYQVGAVAKLRRAAAHWSRSCTEPLLAADPLMDEDRYVEDLERVVKSGRYSILIPGGDPALLVISKHRARLEPHVLMGLPPHETVLRALDKYVLSTAASGTGLAAPETVLCTNVEEARAAALAFGFPVALKPRSSVAELKTGYSHLPGRLVHDEAELAHVAPSYGAEYLVQAAETGPVYSYGGVFAGGRLLASALSRYWRTVRPDGGNVAFSRTLAVPAPLRAGVAQLLGRIGHEGLFELELIGRPDGTFAVIDLNPRPYGSLALAVSAGANLPVVWCEWLRGHRPAPVEARPGFSYRWEEADLFNLACNVRQGRLRAGANVLVPHRRVTHAYFSAVDPGPFAAHALQLASDLSRHGFRDRREVTLRSSR
jgi:peptidoglycan/xylan/chitin deacetylase (PgdA/CDA1 family)/predicted ATP-grasp superfamily ATP-dependent carboligase